MPRKQRFKPSRKPKLIPTPPPEGQSTLNGSTMQHVDIPRSSETEMPPSPPGARRGPMSDKAEAQ